MDSILGPDFPYFASVGNHDTDSWRERCWDRNGCYAKFLKARMARLGVRPDDPDLDDQMYSVTYRGLRLVFVGEGGVRAGDKVYAPSTLLNGDRGRGDKLHPPPGGAWCAAFFIFLNTHGDPTRAHGY